jgi:hypothetical protein
MSTNQTIATLDMDLKVLGDAWIETNLNNFIWPRLPVARSLTRAEGYTGASTFKKPKLGTFRQKGLGYWEPGQSKRDSRNIESDSFTLRTFGRDTQPVTLAISAAPGSASRLKRLESQVVPGMLGELWLNIEYDLAEFLTTTANFGAAKSFTNGGGALDAVADQAAQGPLADIETQLANLRKYRSPSMGWRLVCIMDSLVASVLRRHPDYTGQAYRDGSSAVGASGGAAMLSRSVFEEVFKGLHDLDDVLISASALNTANAGLTETIYQTANGLLWFGIVAPAREYDLTTPTSEDYPDGAFCLAMGGQPEIRETLDERLKVRHFDGEADFGWNVIRGSSFGFFFDPSGAGGIFTTLPT